MYELIYAGKEVEKIVLEKYPNAKIKDASDYIHEERFEAEIKGIDDVEFWNFALEKQFIMACFIFRLSYSTGKIDLIKENNNLIIKEKAELVK